jgi:pSer/pThr/pTyr-binding forkhead associated (FHA) protein
MVLELTVHDRRGSQRRVVVDCLPAILGRGDEANVRVDDPWVSRLHCILNEIDGTLVVRDLGSSNGIFLHGQRVNNSPLLPGDRLELGLTEVAVEYRREAGASVDAVGSESLADAMR